MSSKNDDLKKKVEAAKRLAGTYITTSTGKVGRTHGLYGPYESMDTTGYSKGKKEFIVKTSKSGFKPTTETILRKDVPSKIKEFKKGATSYKKI